MVTQEEISRSLYLESGQMIGLSSVLLSEKQPEFGKLYRRIEQMSRAAKELPGNRAEEVGGGSPVFDGRFP